MFCCQGTTSTAVRELVASTKPLRLGIQHFNTNNQSTYVYAAKLPNLQTDDSHMQVRKKYSTDFFPAVGRILVKKEIRREPKFNCDMLHSSSSSLLLRCSVHVPRHATLKLGRKILACKT